LRRRYDEITGTGGDVVAVGTGDARYAEAFVRDEDVCFPVVLDEEGEAAKAAGVRRGSPRAMVGGGSLRVAWKAMRSGHRQRRTGSRPMQLGATFVVGPGDQVVYEHLDTNPGDHAPVDDVIDALRAART
jgi:peroxiredoxin